MKLLFPAILCLLLAACATPVIKPTVGTDDHQRWLHEQARENFLALKAEERARRGEVEPARTTASTRTASPQPATFTRQPAGSPARSQSAQRSRRTVSNDTIYEPTAEGLAELRAWELRKAYEYRIYEALEAKRLGKTPSQLTREERAWIRANAE